MFRYMHRALSMRSSDGAIAKVRLGALMFILPGSLGGLAPLAPHPGEYEMALLAVPSIGSVVIGTVLWRYQRAVQCRAGRSSPSSSSA